MAGGPIYPISCIPITADKISSGPYVASDSSIQDEGIQVIASLNANATARLVFALPSGALPSGTLKLRLWGLANATAGDAKIDAQWNVVAAAESAQAVTRNAEGVSTLTWGAGDADKYKELLVTLDASAPAADKVLVMDLVFTSASWTLAVVSTWIPALIWV